MRILYGKKLYEKSLASSFDELPLADTPLDQFTEAVLQVIWSGTPTGTLEIYGSNDRTNWTLLSFQNAAGSIVNKIDMAGTASSSFIGMRLLPRYLKMKYTASSGSGNLLVTIEARG